MDRRRIVTASIAALLWHSSGVAALGVIENPANAGVESGIGAITGWHCTASVIELRIDGNSIGRAGSGTPRADTAATCGRSDTGFSLLYNFALLRGGSHRLDAYADGQPFASASFQVSYLGQEFVSGIAAAHQVPDFPSAGQKATVTWVPGKQNFVISSVAPSASGSIVGTYAVRYLSVVMSTGDVASTMEPGSTVTGTMTFRSDGTYTSDFDVSMGGQVSGGKGNGTYADHGHYLLDNGDYLMIVERGETLTLQGLSSAGGFFASSVISMTRVAGAASAAESALAGGKRTPRAASIRTLVASTLMPEAFAR